MAFDRTCFIYLFSYSDSNEMLLQIELAIFDDAAHYWSHIYCHDKSGRRQGMGNNDFSICWTCDDINSIHRHLVLQEKESPRTKNGIGQ